MKSCLKTHTITINSADDFCWVAQRIQLSASKVSSTCGFSFHWGFVFIPLFKLVRHSCGLSQMWSQQASTLGNSAENAGNFGVNPVGLDEQSSNQDGDFTFSIRFIHAAFKCRPVWASCEWELWAASVFPPSCVHSLKAAAAAAILPGSASLNFQLLIMPSVACQKLFSKACGVPGSLNHLPTGQVLGFWSLVHSQFESCVLNPSPWN